MSAAIHSVKRFCDVAAALDARRMARHLRLQGFTSHADMAWSLVHCHLRRAAAAKARSSS
jgi:hypothetical protein